WKWFVSYSFLGVSHVPCPPRRQSPFICQPRLRRANCRRWAAISLTRRREAMRKFQQWVHEFVRREDGPTAVEYAVMLALIIVVCITAITTLGKNANNTFVTVGNAIGAAGS